MTTYEYILSIRDKASSSLRMIQNTGDKTYRNLISHQNNLNSVVGKFGGILAAFGGGFALVTMGEKAITAYDNLEGSLANVKAGIESTHAAAGKTLEQFRKEAEQLRDKSIFGTSGILENVTAQLETFPNIVGEQFSRAQQAIVDVTAKLGGINSKSEDLHRISIMVGKALNYPTMGMMAMQRVGIQFSKQQQEQIKYYDQTNQLVKAQSIILNEIQRQYGGTAAALAATEPGKQILTLNQINGAYAKMGEILSPIKTKFLEFKLKVIEGLTQLFEWIKRNKDIIEGIVAPIMAFIGTLWLASKAAAVAEGAIYLFNIACDTNPILLITGAVIGLSVAFDQAYSSSDRFKNFMDQLWGTIKDLGLGIIEFFTGPYKIIAKIGEALYALSEGRFKDSRKLFNEVGEVATKSYDKFIKGFQFKKNWDESKDWTGGASMFGDKKNSPLYKLNHPDNPYEPGKDMMAGIAGNSKPQIINITIGKLNESININSETIEGGANKIEQIMIPMMLRVVNSANRLR